MIINRVLFTIQNFVNVLRFRLSGNRLISFRAIVTDSILGESVLLFPKSDVTNSKIGDFSYLGRETRLPKSLIGKYTSIGDNVSLIQGIHPTSKYVSTHPLTYSNRMYCGKRYVDKTEFKEYGYIDSEQKYALEIGNDVWVASNVLFVAGKNGIRVGDGAIIAAGAVVTKDVEPYSIVGGVPAKLIKYRFSEEQIAQLKKIRWWEQSEDWIREHIGEFDDVEKFLESCRDI